MRKRCKTTVESIKNQENVMKLMQNCSRCIRKQKKHKFLYHVCSSNVRKRYKTKVESINNYENTIKHLKKITKYIHQKKH